LTIANNVTENVSFTLSLGWLSKRVQFCVKLGVVADMLRTFVHGKIHGVRITECKLRYNGSAEIDTALLAASGIAPFEQIQVVNMNTGARLVTYAFPGQPGSFTLNGGAARLGAVGDDCLVIAYRQEEVFSGAQVVFIDPTDNSIRDEMHYPSAKESQGKVLEKSRRVE